MQAVHCWELGIKAVIVLEQAQVTSWYTLTLVTFLRPFLFLMSCQRALAFPVAAVRVTD